ncbi:MAG: hypothetical protein MI806_01255 [Minwuiales bacterium]|nr:hypothetical protein [Minwuiales bacterium]
MEPDNPFNQQCTWLCARFIPRGSGIDQSFIQSAAQFPPAQTVRPTVTRAKTTISRIATAFQQVLGAVQSANSLSFVGIFGKRDAENLVLVASILGMLPVFAKWKCGFPHNLAAHRQ